MPSSLYLAAGCALDASADEMATAAALAGYDGLSLRLSGEHSIEPRRATEFSRLLDELGVFVHDVEVHRIGPQGADPATLVDMAARLGARYVLVVSDVRNEARTIDELGRFSEQCRAAGLTAALEYMAWTMPNASADALRIAEATDAAVVSDLLHHHRLGEGAVEIGALAATGRLAWVQLCDAPAIAPTGGNAALIEEARHRRLPPGHGELPLLDLLRAVPAETPMSIEVQSDELRHIAVETRATMLHRAALVTLACAHDPSSTG